MFSIIFVAASIIICVVAIVIQMEFSRGELDILSFYLGKSTMILFPKTPSRKIEDVIISRRTLSMLSWPNNYLYLNPHIKFQDFNISSYSSNSEEYAPITVRIYSLSKQKPDAIIVWYHGGGFTRGDVSMDNALCGDFVLHSNALVVSVNYRLAPEYPFPIPVLDALSALRWTSKHIHEFGGDPNRIFLAGESAGATLAAAVAAMNLDKVYTPSADRVNVLGTALVYPVTDMAVESESYKLYGTVSGLLTPNTVRVFADHYCGEQNNISICNLDYRFSPIRIPPRIFKKFPPTAIVMAKYDILLDDGHRFAEKLRKYLRDIQTHQYNNTVHGFFGKRIFRSGYTSLQLVSQFFNRLVKEIKH